MKRQVGQVTKVKGGFLIRQTVDPLTGKPWEKDEQRLHIHLLFHTLPATIVPVADYAAASKAMRELVDKHGLGSSDMRKGCGDVKDATGNKVYRVSYNGRCWVGNECVFGA